MTKVLAVVSSAETVLWNSYSRVSTSCSSSTSIAAATTTPLRTVPLTSTRTPTARLPGGVIWLASTAMPLTSKAAGEVNAVIEPSTAAFASLTRSLL